MSDFTILGQNLSDNVLVVSHEMGDGGEYVLITLDCAIVRVKRDDEGVVVDLHEPVSDGLVASICETANDLWAYHKEAR
jgi:hypothetical protein